MWSDRNECSDAKIRHYCDIGPASPLKYGAPFAVYGSMLDSYGAAAVSFDLAIQQRGNNGRRSPKGERLQMSVGSVQKASMPSTQR